MLENGAEPYRKMLKGINYKSILEIGSSIGMNLKYLTAITNDNVELLYAVEPNQKAYSSLVADKNIRLIEAWNKSVYDIPLPDESII